MFSFPLIRGHRSPGHHVDSGSLADIFVGRSATKWLRLANQCSREPIYRITSDGGLRVTARSSTRVVNGKRLECRTAFGDFGFTVP